MAKRKLAASEQIANGIAAALIGGITTACAVIGSSYFGEYQNEVFLGFLFCFWLTMRFDADSREDSE